METIRKGSRGDSVKVLQRALNLIADGIFGSITEEAVKEYQKSKGLRADGVVGDRTWEKILGVKTCLRKITKIIVHCTAEPEGRNSTLEQIRAYHTAPKPKGCGWSDIGYHFLVTLDGKVHTGRDINKIGAHCDGQNTYSVGVCYVGGLAKDCVTPKDTRTEAQKKGLREILWKLRAMFPNATIHGHREFAAKDCPSFDVRKEYGDI